MGSCSGWRGAGRHSSLRPKQTGLGKEPGITYKAQVQVCVSYLAACPALLAVLHYHQLLLLLPCRQEGQSAPHELEKEDLKVLKLRTRGKESS